MIFPAQTLYAQLDQIDSIQDYAPNEPCLRLIGVNPKDFQNAAFNTAEGCSTYLIDVSWGDFLKTKIKYHPDAPDWKWPREPHPELENWPSYWWLKLQYREVSLRDSGTYAYELFANANPNYVILDSMSLLKGPAVAALQTPSKAPSASANQLFRLYAYHVGQGMCALLKGGTEGFLFDMGAGVPVTRPDYQSGHHANGAPFVNELAVATSGLALQAIISHPDSDHWRLLDWDSTLRGAVSAIFTPTGTPALALKSTHVLSKVHAIGDTAVHDSAGVSLFDIHRSQPSTSTRNNECLLVETKSCGSILLPGDYVYNEWSSDGNSAIRALATSSCEAVMVPHHGDAASAKVGLSPKSSSSPAFFSAGTHKHYKHPTAASINAHQTQGFVTIDRHTLDDILECPLP